MTFQEQTAPLLRTDQIDEMGATKKGIEKMLADNRPHVAGQITDRAGMVKQLNSINHDLETQMPRAYGEHELDAAVAREKELRELWLRGMPTQEEMRRNPSGATDKHMNWEWRNKKKILEWKNIRRRLVASGAHEGKDTGPYTSDIANIELYRPSGGAGELNMHGEQIPGKVIHQSPIGADPVAVLTPEREEALREIEPGLLAKIALLDNEQRAKVFDIIDGIIAKDVTDVLAKAAKPKKAKKPKSKYADTEIAKVRAEAKALGIKSFQKGLAELKVLIVERQGV